MTEREILLVEEAKKQGFEKGRNKAAMITAKLQLVDATKAIMALTFADANQPVEAA